jgi:hypothetical protein
MKTKITIEKGIPVPEGHMSGMSVAIRAMEIGDSFEAIDSNYHQRIPATWGSLLAPKKFTSRRLDNGNRRIWRIA